MKTTVQQNVLDENKNVIAVMSTELEGDGTTPVVMTQGTSEVLGYNDDGSAIITEIDESLLAKEQQVFMSKVIAQQKFLTEQNGLNSGTVNINQ